MEIADINLFGTKYGTPVLFPMPNRVKDSVYRWNGKDYTLTKRGEKSLMDLTPAQIIEAALDMTDPNVFTEKHKAAIRATWLPLFEQPGT